MINKSQASIPGGAERTLGAGELFAYSKLPVDSTC